jgi:hypothetical protein
MKYPKIDIFMSPSREKIQKLRHLVQVRRLPKQVFRGGKNLIKE